MHYELSGRTHKKECQPHNRYFMIRYKIKDLAELESIRLDKLGLKIININIPVQTLQ